jgi:hypothetical protein
MARALDRSTLGSLTSWIDLRGGWPEVAWALVILSLSFNLYAPGNPQPGDFAMVALLCVPIVFLRSRMPPAIRRPVLSLAAFVTYVFACNFIWAAITTEYDFLKSSAFYAFNFSVFLGYLVMLGERGDDWLRWTLYGFAATLVVLVILSIPFAHKAQSGRLQLFFVNPNQLAYHVLLCASIVAILSQRYHVPTPVLYGLLLCALYIELRTYSRAGVLGVALLGALQIVKRPTVLTLVMLPVLGVALYLDLQALDTTLWESRLDLVESSTTEDYLTDRGIERLIEHPRYLIAGAGEGGYGRFHHAKLEVHSSAATLLFSYGLFGTGLFLLFLRWLSIATGPQLLVMMVPALSYSLFHQGLRARPFWLMLAVALGVGVLTAVEAAKARQRPLTIAER